MVKNADKVAFGICFFLSVRHKKTDVAPMDIKISRIKRSISFRGGSVYID